MISAPGKAAGPGDAFVPAIFLVAGEPSGDRLGARLMAALKRRFGTVSFAGVGGTAMAAEGLSSLYPMSDLTLMGFTEVLPHLPRLMRRLRETVAAIDRERPQLVVTIDSPGFNGRLLDRLRGHGIPRVHYVAPAVWAWRPGRIRHWRGRVDRLLAILPFEPPIFAAAGIDCRYVGHPVLEEEGVLRADGAGFRRRHEIVPEAPLVGLLPGSRPGEIRHILPALIGAADRLRAAEPGLRFVLPTLPALANLVRAGIAGLEPPLLLLEEARHRFDAFAACNLALAASGTVTLELAALRTPTVLVYRAGSVSAALARRLIRVRHVGLPNLLLDRPLVPELLQERCTPASIAAAALTLLRDPKAGTVQQAGFSEVMARLAVEGRPSERAAEAVAGLLEAPAPTRGPRPPPPVGCPPSPHNWP